MTDDLLGLPVEAGIRKLNDANIRYTLKEVRCNKGTGGREDRIIAARPLPDGSVEVLHAFFVTDIE